MRYFGLFKRNDRVCGEKTIPRVKRQETSQASIISNRAVVFMHGVTENAENGRELLHWIQRDFPGIRTYALTSFQDSKSLVPLETQVEVLQMEIYQWLSIQPTKIRVHF